MEVNNKVRVLMVATTLVPRIVSLISKLSSRYEIHVIYVAYPSILKMLGNNAREFHHWPIKCSSKIFSLAETRGFRLIYLLPTFVDMLVKIIRVRKNYDVNIIHVYDVVPSGFMAALSCRGVPLIVGLRGSDIKVFGKKLMFKFPIKYALKRATKIVALSNDLKQEAIKLGVKDDKICVIPGGLDVNKFKPLDKRAARAKLRLPEGFLILFAGNLIKLKKVDKLIRVSANLSKDFDCHLLIAGDGPEREKLKELAKYLELRNILFKGRVLYEDMPLYMAASDVLVLSSESEGLPDCIQESMACGVPVVANGVGGLPDLITNGVNGYLINNEAEMEERLRLMMSSPDLLSMMGANALEFARQNLSLDIVVKQIEKLYLSLQ